MKDISNKKFLEIAHGAKIKDRAEIVWGWAGIAGEKRAQRRANYLFKLGELVLSDVALELGCGTGEFTVRLQEKGIKKLVSMDISLDLIKQAKSKLQNKNVYFVVADAEAMPFKDNSFNTITGVSILHHLNIDTALKGIFMLLKQNGKLVFSEPNMLNPQIFLVKNIIFLKRICGDVDSESAFVRWHLNNKLKKSGFINIAVFPFDFLHPVTPQRLISFVCLIEKVIEKIPVLREIAGSLLIYAQKY
ncbi:MAG: class I SAM-dependent methyltransferase [Candidatus Omnitrophica bacterium]|nr:class I SAM-dependent methyltransferase [Candidatus Omnitrophota bacterium]